MTQDSKDEFYFVKKAVQGPYSSFPTNSTSVSAVPPFQGSTYPMAGTSSLRPNPQTRSTFFDTDATGARRNLNIGQEQSPMKTPELPQLPKEAGHAAMRSALKFAEDDSAKAPVFTDFEEFKKKLKPGDIILGKHEKKGIDPYTLLIRAFTDYPWGHAMIYTGDGEIKHMSRVRHGSGKMDMESEATIRDHKLETMAKGQYDLHAVRPNLPKKEREEAIQRLKDLGHPSFSYHDFLQLGYFPWGKTEVNRLAQENNRKALRDKIQQITCSGAVALAYPKIDFRKNKSALFVRPSDFLTSDQTTSVARFISEKNEKNASAGTQAGLERLQYILGSHHDSPLPPSALGGWRPSNNLIGGAAAVGGAGLLGYGGYKLFKHLKNRNQDPEDRTLDKVDPSTRNITPTSGVVGFPGGGTQPGPLPEDKPQVRGDWGGAIWR